jgi:type II secretory pathway pseudopilin PulG
VRSSGFSVIEVLIAAAVLLVTTIGVLPLFTRSITNNLQGQQATSATNLARSHMEALYQVAFTAVEITVPDGEDELEVVDYWSESEHAWINEDDWEDTETEAYTRTTVVRQYNISSLAGDNELTPEEALPGGTDPSLLHVKEIVVTVTSANLGPLAPGKTVVLRSFRPF